MSRWTNRLLAIAVIAGLLSAFWASSVLAQSAGTGPDSALVPSGATQSLAQGQRVWYAFQSGGDSAAQISIRMSSDPQGSATFSVWSPENVTSWKEGDVEDPVGRGTQQIYRGGTPDEHVLFNGDLVWFSTFEAAGTYYVVVDQAGPTAGTYTLTVSGSDVALGPAAPQMASAASSGQETELDAPVVLPATGVSASSQAAPAGSGPAQALDLPNGQPTTLAMGAERWYKFQNGGSDFQTFIQLHSASGSATFNVWTPDRLRDWVDGNGMNPVGAGTKNTIQQGTDEAFDLYGGDLIWSGDFAGPGTYYVQVQQQGSAPATFTLNVSESLKPNTTS